jgi:ribonuclease HI
MYFQKQFVVLVDMGIRGIAKGQMIALYTDGASSGNPGPGGYGIILRSGKYYKELSGGYQKTTNNRMELLAVVIGLEAIKKQAQEVTVYSDSKYVVDSVEKCWVFGWAKKGFQGKKNADLWLRFLDVYRKHTVKFVWIKGHASHPENERCDELAVKASKQEVLLVDVGYERGN